MMRVGSAVVAIAALSFVVGVAPAEAAKKKRYGYELPRYSSSERVRLASRPRARVTVTRRSYLDAGTEVYPGSMHYTDYVFPPGHSPYKNFDPTGAYRWPLPNDFELRSYHSPGGGY